MKLKVGWTSERSDNVVRFLLDNVVMGLRIIVMSISLLKPWKTVLFKIPVQITVPSDAKMIRSLGNVKTYNTFGNPKMFVIKTVSV